MSLIKQGLILLTLSAICLLVFAGAATGQTIVRSFDGDSGPGLAACEPATATVADSRK
jgi:hypothetical protein